jgi:hypothetical protein
MLLRLQTLQMTFGSVPSAASGTGYFTTPIVFPPCSIILDSIHIDDVLVVVSILHNGELCLYQLLLSLHVDAVRLWSI